MVGPLDGVTIIELGGFIAGPFAGQILGDYGARLIKIEPPAGDPMRTWGVCKDGRSLWWPTIGRNKESVVLDLHDESDRRTAARLCESADVVLENFAPGRLAEWGLDYRTLAAANPRLVMVHISGFGQDGPRAQDRGFGSIAEAMGGLRNVMGFPDRPPVRSGISLGDAVGGLFAVAGALSALHERDRSGRGQEVDVALTESVLALMESLLADWELAHAARPRTGSSLAGVAPSNAYPTADGRDLLIAANSDPLFRRLAKAMGAPELAEDERFATHHARGEHAAELDELIAAWTGGLAVEEIEAILDEFQIPRGRIFTAEDILADAQYRARDMIVRMPAADLGEDVPMAGVVPKFSRTPGEVRHAGPRLGAHTDSILATSPSH